LRQPASLKGAYVVVVEDECLQALDIAHSLAEAGAVVLGPVSTAQKAFEIIGDHPCDAGILDFRLAGDDIVAFALELDRRGIPFVINSGYDCAYLAQWIARQSHNCRFLSKPSPMADLIRAVAEMVGKPQPIRERLPILAVC
jgi:DNA-binding NtrC family response regulator